MNSAVIPDWTVCNVFGFLKNQKELGERKSISIDFVRQIMPLPKMYTEVIVCDTHSSVDSRGHKTGDSERRQVRSILWLIFRM